MIFLELLNIGIRVNISENFLIVTSFSLYLINLKNLVSCSKIYKKFSMFNFLKKSRKYM